MKKVNIFQYHLQCHYRKHVFLGKRQWINGLKGDKV
jgi:hypothetical protein